MSESMSGEEVQNGDNWAEAYSLISQAASHGAFLAMTVLTGCFDYEVEPR
jgi:hypothetical protein